MRIILRKFSYLILFSLFLSGCGGGSNNGTDSYQGYWKHEFVDTYLEIRSDNIARIRACSLNDGYVETDSGTLVDDELTIGSAVFNLALSGDSLIVTDDIIGAEVIFSRVASIPGECTGDAIEITSVTPSSVNEGVLTTFTVNFDYRLVSVENAIVDVGFNNTDPNIARLTEDTWEINSASLGSGWFVVDMTPVYYAEPDNFIVSVFLSENPHPTKWFPLSSSQSIITVTQNAGTLGLNSNVIEKKISNNCDVVFGMRCD